MSNLNQRIGMLSSACEHPDLPLLSSFDFSPTERIALHILRALFGGCEHENLEFWEGAFNLGEKYLGPVNGAALVARCVTLMRALRSERKGGFCYLSNSCPHISEDEQDLMDLIRTGREKQSGDERLAAAVRRVATCQNPTGLTTAARALAALCISLEKPNSQSAVAQRQASMLLN